MASTASELRDGTRGGSIARSEKPSPTAYRVRADSSLPYTYSDDSLKPILDDTHRKLKPRHIQLIGIGGYTRRLALRPRAQHADVTRIAPLARRFSSKLVGVVLKILVKHVSNWDDRQRIDTGEWLRKREE